jgi:cytochrome c
MKKQKKKYEKPILIKEKTMSFPIEIIVSGKKIVCRQCSACHGCR